MYQTSQKTLRRAGPLAAVAAMALLGAPQVHAQAIGFLWNNNPTTPGTTTPATNYSYNSSGGAISITRNSTGNYIVDFAGLGNSLQSDVQVTAYGTGPNYCISGGWSSSNGTDVDATVYCYNPAGNLADNSFTMLYQSRQSGDETTPTVAYLWANEPTSPSYIPDTSYQYNPSGGTNTVTSSGTGNYTANLPGLDRKGGTVLVTAYGSTAAHCQVTDWGSDSSGTTVNVNCTDATGAAADEQFDLVYSIFETAGYGPGSGNGGAIWAYNDTRKTPYDVSKRYSINIDGEEMFAQRIAKGQYVWSMNVEDQWTSSTVLVTAYDAPGSYCNTYYWSSTSTETYVYVNCFDAAGAPSNTRFTATFQLAGCCTIRGTDALDVP
jgi:hypothetical protein